MTKQLSGRMLYERFASFLGVEPRWPEDPKGEDITRRDAWERLAATIEEDVQARVAAIVNRRDSPPSLTGDAERAQAFDPEG